eukprot:5221073-Pyramimonas_sp.AAC.1
MGPSWSGVLCSPNESASSVVEVCKSLFDLPVPPNLGPASENNSHLWSRQHVATAGGPSGIGLANASPL